MRKWLKKISSNAGWGQEENRKSQVSYYWRRGKEIYVKYLLKSLITTLKRGRITEKVTCHDSGSEGLPNVEAGPEQQTIPLYLASAY